jgi:LysR family transcriptional regulator, transcriptional activator of nhaA
MNRPPMDPDQLNYHHLRYFWVVVREGSIARACDRLHVSQPTISGQLKAFETSIGAALFTKRGRQIVATSLGESIASYADDIFNVGRKLTDHLNGGGQDRRRLALGVCDQVPKLIAYNIIEPALSVTGGVHLNCPEDEAKRLFAALAVHQLDAVLSDQPLPVGFVGHQTLLGETSVSFFAAKNLKPQELKKNFPVCLNQAPILLPHAEISVRQQIDSWLRMQEVTPILVGEFQDSALMKVFGQSGKGIFIAPSVIAEMVEKQYDVMEIGRSDLIRERFYLITRDRRMNNPALMAITKEAKRLFA